MKKKGLFLGMAILFFISFVSAFGYGNYGSFSIGDFFSNFDSATITYTLLFLILLTIIHLSLSKSRIFRGSDGEPNVVASGVVSFSLSALIVYYLYNSGYNLDSVIGNLGFSGDLTMYLIIAFVIIALLMIWRLGFSGFCIVMGLFLIIASFFGLVYESGVTLVIGGVLLLMGFFFWRRTRGKFVAGGRYIASKPASSGWLGILLGILLLVIGIAFGSIIVIIAGILLAVIMGLLKFRRHESRIDPAYQEPHQVNID